MSSNPKAVTIRLFARLRQEMGVDTMEIDHAPGMTVRQIWRDLAKGRPVPANLLTACNREYCKLDDPVSPGDEIAFFPPITGG